MSKVFIEESSLTAIGDAIREKTGSSDKMSPAQMVTAIGSITGGGGGELEPITLSGAGGYGFAGNVVGLLINQQPNLFQTQNLDSISYLFYANRTVERIPFTINLSATASTNGVSAESMFYSCEKLTEVPEFSAGKITGCKGMFDQCYKLKKFPDNWGENLDWSSLKTNAYANCNAMFQSCNSLRKIPQVILENVFAGCGTGANYCAYNTAFSGCSNLDEVLNIGVNTGSLTTNRMSTMFNACYCLKRITFATNEDGTPKTAKWKSQILDLSSNVGYCLPTYSWYLSDIENNCSERVGKRIYDDATYAALKNDPDAYTGDTTNNNTCYHWSLYNKASALETIKSLPDCSATGTNTIKFRGEAGLKTDGGAINTLTEDEIAIATAKGWTVQFV